MKKKILVTGSTGFLGSNLISKITNNNAYEIYGVSKKTKNIILKNKNLTYTCIEIYQFIRKYLSLKYLYNSKVNIYPGLLGILFL